MGAACCKGDQQDAPTRKKSFTAGRKVEESHEEFAVVSSARAGQQRATTTQQNAPSSCTGIERDHGNFQCGVEAVALEINSRSGSSNVSGNPSEIRSEAVLKGNAASNSANKSAACPVNSGLGEAKRDNTSVVLSSSDKADVEQKHGSGENMMPNHTDVAASSVYDDPNDNDSDDWVAEATAALDQHWQTCQRSKVQGLGSDSCQHSGVTNPAQDFSEANFHIEEEIESTLTVEPNPCVTPRSPTSPALNRDSSISMIPNVNMKGSGSSKTAKLFSATPFIETEGGEVPKLEAHLSTPKDKPSKKAVGDEKFESGVNSELDRRTSSTGGIPAVPTMAGTPEKGAGMVLGHSLSLPLISSTSAMNASPVASNSGLASNSTFSTQSYKRAMSALSLSDLTPAAQLGSQLQPSSVSSGSALYYPTSNPMNPIVPPAGGTYPRQAPMSAPSNRYIKNQLRLRHNMARNNISPELAALMGMEKRPRRTKASSAGAPSWSGGRNSSMMASSSSGSKAPVNVGRGRHKQHRSAAQSAPQQLWQQQAMMHRLQHAQATALQAPTSSAPWAHPSGSSMAGGSSTFSAGGGISGMSGAAPPTVPMHMGQNMMQGSAQMMPYAHPMHPHMPIGMGTAQAPHQPLTQMNLTVSPSHASTSSSISLNPHSTRGKGYPQMYSQHLPSGAYAAVPSSLPNTPFPGHMMPSAIPVGLMPPMQGMPTGSSTPESHTSSNPSKHSHPGSEGIVPSATSGSAGTPKRGSLSPVATSHAPKSKLRDRNLRKPHSTGALSKGPDAVAHIHVDGIAGSQTRVRSGPNRKKKQLHDDSAAHA